MVKRSLLGGVNHRLTALLKLNILSAISGFLFFISIESGLNIYRIERLTGLGFATLKKYLFYFFHPRLCIFDNHSCCFEQKVEIRFDVQVLAVCSLVSLFLPICSHLYRLIPIYISRRLTIGGYRIYRHLRNTSIPFLFNPH